MAGRPRTRRELTRGNDNDNEQDDDANDEAHAHLHVLPPHLLAHAVGAPSEALGRCSEVVGLVLERVETLAALTHGLNVLLHCCGGLPDFLCASQYMRLRCVVTLRFVLQRCTAASDEQTYLLDGFGAVCARLAAVLGAAGGDVGIIRLLAVGHGERCGGLRVLG
jgi:hypothetical protein